MSGDVQSSHRLQVADYVIFSLSIAISLGIGVLHAFIGKPWKVSIEEYLVGGRSMSYLAPAISLVVTYLSAITMLGLPAEAYFFGAEYLWFALSSCLSMLLAAHTGVAIFYPLKITSIYEYLELRFESRAVRLLGSVIGILQNIVYMACVLLAPALAMEAVSGYPVWNSTVITTIAAVIYTSLGGIKAVIWTDVFQSLVMLSLVLAVLIQGTVEVGGATQVWNIAESAGRINFWDFNPDPTIRHTFWSLTIGAFFVALNFFFHNSTVTRLVCIKSEKEAKRLLHVSTPMYLVAVVMVVYEGITAFSYFQTKQCDPLASGQISNPNQLIPWSVMVMFGHLPGMSGLLLAALFSATLSTLSSGIASGAAVIWTDLVQPLVGDISESKSNLIIKGIVVLFGGVACAVSFIVGSIGGTLVQVTLTVSSAFSSPQTGLFVLGCLFPRCNAKGAFLGGLISLAVTVWITTGISFSTNIPRPVPLELASTDLCPSNILLNNSNNSSSGFMATATTAESFLLGTNDTVPGTSEYFTSSNMTSTPTPSVLEPRGIEHLYTISYQYISVVGSLTTIIVGMLVSWLTGMNQPGDVDPIYLTSISDSLLFYLPGRVRRYISSRGPQFMDEKYKRHGSAERQRGEYQETSFSTPNGLAERYPFCKRENGGPAPDLCEA